MKMRLFTPGPTMVPESVSLEMAEPIIHHRTPEFSEILETSHDRLQYLFQTQKNVLMMTCSGSGAMEGAIVSVLSTKTPTLVVRGGKFGERWGELCQAYGVPMIPLDVPWGESVTPEMIQGAFDEHPEIKAVCLTHSETSTGALVDVKAVAAVVKKNSALCIVDGITSIGVHEFRFDEWGIDVAITGSQKALMLPPGLAFAAVSDEAWEAAEKSDIPSYYLSYLKHKKAWGKNTTPFTPAITLLVGLQKALGMIQSEGLEAVWHRHQRLADAMHAGVHALGLAIFPRVPANVQTVIAVPEGLDAKSVMKRLLDGYGMKIAGGQDHLLGKILRIAHVGYMDDADVMTAVSCLERALDEEGWDVRPGEAVAAAQQVFMSPEV
jgi:serine---pyruvate transaminase